MQNLFKEACEAVYKLNVELFEIPAGEKLSVEEGMTINYETNGYAAVVTFLGVTIWSSEDDVRNYDEVKDEYEDIIDFLRRKINDLCVLVSEIELDKVEPVEPNQ
ncbi:MAG: hypothetical protein WC375_07890 [Methanomassiliicoccales archaeon]|jgi:hypothetical protein